MNNRRKALIHTGLTHYRIISTMKGQWAVQRLVWPCTRERDGWEDTNRPTDLLTAKSQLLAIAAYNNAKGEII